MSRSKKKHPGGGITAGCGQHKFKKKECRSRRHLVKQLLCVEEYEDLPHWKEHGNEWSSPRDGKLYWMNHDAKWMRK